MEMSWKIVDWVVDWLIVFSFSIPPTGREWSINKYAGKENLENKTVIVTGANSGIGLKLSEELARRKAKVIMACRDDDECIFLRRKIVNETGNGKVYCSKLDLSSLDSVREFVGRINQSNFIHQIVISIVVF